MKGSHTLAGFKIFKGFLDDPRKNSYGPSGPEKSPLRIWNPTLVQDLLDINVAVANLYVKLHSSNII